MRSLATILTTTLVCGAAAAATPDYDAVIRDALATGYGLRPDSLAGAASVAAMHADNTLAGPEAEMEYLWPSDGTDNRWSLSLSQSFDWPGAYRARRAEAQTAEEAVRAVYEVATLDKAFEVKMLVLDIINARQRIGLLRSTLTNVDLMDSLIRVAYDREAATALDIRKSALARLDISSNIAVAEADLADLEAQLAAQGIHMPTSGWDVYPAQILHTQPLGAEEYPEYRASVARRQAARAAVKAARTAALPGFAVGYTHAYEDKTHLNGFSVSVTLPSWSRRQRTRAAELEAMATGAETDAALSIARAQTESQHIVAQRLHDELEAYRHITGDNSYLELLEKAYAGGLITVIDYLSEINHFTEARMRYLDLEYRYQQTLARLNKPRSAYFN